MKKLSALLFLLLFALILTGALSVSALSEDCAYVDTQKDIIFWVEGDVEVPSVVFISPSGDEFDPSVQADGTAAFYDGNTILYEIKEAQSGQWRVSYELGNNTEIEISAHDDYNGIYIEEFNLVQLEGDRAELKFKLAGEDVRASYTISALTEYSGPEKELASGTARIDRDISTTVRLNELSSYDSYMLKLYVRYSENGVDYFDIMYTEPFAYVNKEADEYKLDFTVTVYPEEYLVKTEWGKVDFGVDEYLVALFEDAESEPVVFDTYKKRETGATLGYDPSATSVAVEATAKHSGVNGAPVRVEFDPASPKIKIKEGESFSSTLLPVEYVNTTGNSAYVSVNGKRTDLVLNGDGKLEVTLDEGWNDFEFKYFDDNSVIWAITRQIYVDNTAPIIVMSKEYDGIRTADTSIVISGTVSDATSVELNENILTLDQNNAFSSDVKLNPGENIITVVASDALGNECLYTAQIFSGNEQTTPAVNNNKSDSPADREGFAEKLDDGFLPLMISGGICVLVIIYAIVFWKKSKKNKEAEK